MLTILNTLTALKSNKRGATAIEYGLIAAGIAVAIITILATLGDTLTAMFGEVNTAIGG